MAKRRRRKKSSLDEMVAPVGWVIVIMALAALVLAIVALVVVTAVIDVAVNAYGRLRGRKTRGFRLTSGLSRFVLSPFRHYPIVWRLFRQPPLRVETIGELLALTASEFEEAIAQSLRDRDYRNVTRRGGPGDLGVDITCIDPNGQSLAVQCKRYGPGNLVGSRELQLFIGMIATEHRTERGLFVTTSGFTQPARALAERHGIRLMDGLDLARVLGADGPPQVGPSEPVFVEMDDEHLGEMERAAAAGVRLPGEIVRPLGGDGLPGVRYANAGDADVASELLEAFLSGIVSEPAEKVERSEREREL